MAEVLMPELEKALTGLTLHLKRFDEAIDFLAHGPKMANQLSLVVLLKHSWKVSPLAGAEPLCYLMALLKREATSLLALESDVSLEVAFH